MLFLKQLECVSLNVAALACNTKQNCQKLKCWNILLGNKVSTLAQYNVSASPTVSVYLCWTNSNIEFCERQMHAVSYYVAFWRAWTVYHVTKQRSESDCVLNWSKCQKLVPINDFLSVSIKTTVIDMFIHLQIRDSRTSAWGCKTLRSVATKSSVLIPYCSRKSFQFLLVSNWTLSPGSS